MVRRETCVKLELLKTSSKTSVPPSPLASPRFQITTACHPPAVAMLLHLDAAALLTRINPCVRINADSITGLQQISELIP